MTTTFYIKEGDEYIPTKEYDNVLWEAVPINSATLTVSKRGSSLRTYNVDIALAPIIAAGLFARDAFVNAISDVGAIRMSPHLRQQPLTPSQKEAWDKLVEELGEDARMLEWPSVQEVAMAGIKELENEMEKMLSVPAVKNAYEQFLMVWKLTKENSDG
jgi:hypothetical protein